MYSVPSIADRLKLSVTLLNIFDGSKQCSAHGDLEMLAGLHVCKHRRRRFEVVRLAPSGRREMLQAYKAVQAASTIIAEVVMGA